MNFQRQAQAEMESARTKWGAFHNHHEAYAVLLEEVQEYWDEVRKKDEHRIRERMRQELIQVAAVAQRIAEDLT